jgi:hypothetical protein
MAIRIGASFWNDFEVFVVVYLIEPTLQLLYATTASFQSFLRVIQASRNFGLVSNCSGFRLVALIKQQQQTGILSTFINNCMAFASREELYTIFIN